MDEWIRMKQCMEDSGCSAAAITRAKNFYQAGAVDDLIRFLRSCRCEFKYRLQQYFCTITGRKEKRRFC